VQYFIYNIATCSLLCEGGWQQYQQLDSELEDVMLPSQSEHDISSHVISSSQPDDSVYNQPSSVARKPLVLGLAKICNQDRRPTRSYRADSNASEMSVTQAQETRTVNRRQVTPSRAQNHFRKEVARKAASLYGQPQ
jgi:hypothetical protein